MILSSRQDNLCHCLLSLSFKFNLDPHRLAIHPILCGVELPPSHYTPIIPLGMASNRRNMSSRLDRMEHDIEDLKNFVQTIQERLSNLSTQVLVVLELSL